MIRVQVYLGEDEERWLEEQAAVRSTTKSALIREGIHALQSAGPFSDEAHMLKLVGHIKGDDSGPNDFSIDHDKYLVEWEFQRTRPGT